MDKGIAGIEADRAFSGLYPFCYSASLPLRSFAGACSVAGNKQAALPDTDRGATSMKGVDLGDVVRKDEDRGNVGIIPKVANGDDPKLPPKNALSRIARPMTK